jgi:hypothetical protein
MLSSCIKTVKRPRIKKNSHDGILLKLKIYQQQMLWVTRLSAEFLLTWSPLICSIPQHSSIAVPPISPLYKESSAEDQLLLREIFWIFNLLKNSHLVKWEALQLEVVDLHNHQAVKMQGMCY